MLTLSHQNILWSILIDFFNKQTNLLRKKTAKFTACLSKISFDWKKDEKEIES